MILLDVNILLYAHNEGSRYHARARQWLDTAWEKGEEIGLPWITAWGFVRLTTNPKVLPTPKTPVEACSVIRELVAQPGVRIVQPGARHLELLEHIMTEFGATGPRATDAVLAALALEHGASVATADRDFGRFTAVKWINPLA